jgi:hypothetical protein
MRWGYSVAHQCNQSRELPEHESIKQSGHLPHKHWRTYWQA